MKAASNRRLCHLQDGYPPSNSELWPVNALLDLAFASESFLLLASILNCASVRAGRTEVPRTCERRDEGDGCRKRINSELAVEWATRNRTTAAEPPSTLRGHRHSPSPVDRGYPGDSKEELPASLNQLKKNAAHTKLLRYIIPISET